MEVNSQNITVTITAPEVRMEIGLRVEKRHSAWADWLWKERNDLMRNRSHRDDSTNFSGTIHKELFGLSLKKLGLYHVL